MTEEVLINVTPYASRIAMVENGILKVIIIEPTKHQSLVGNIYKGKVSRLLPGMQAAFIDIGLERDAFLHLSDLVNDKNELISKSLHIGETLLVQVIKEPLGTKGARLTGRISIPSCYMVFLPYSPNMIGVSSRIESKDERKRLKEIVLQKILLKKQNYGFIIRTGAEGATEPMLWADMEFLSLLWQEIKEKEIYTQCKSLIYKDLSLVLSSIRDLIGDSVDKIRIDSQESYQELINFAKKFMPDWLPRIEYYTDNRPIFYLYNIEEEINKALEPKVILKSGGYLVIEQTEAMITIDVNTGSYIGGNNLENTIFKINLEAAKEIPRQLRLRNLGGLIILDFIDMLEPEHKLKVLDSLKKCLARDPNKSTVSELSSLGLVEMTRKRTRESLEHILCKTCPTCAGRGSIKNSHFNNQ
jgi:ribonuclease G